MSGVTADSLERHYFHTRMSHSSCMTIYQTSAKEASEH